MGHRNLTSSFGAIVCNENSEWTQILTKGEGAVVSSSCKMQGLPVPQQQKQIETSRLPVIFGDF